MGLNETQYKNIFDLYYKELYGYAYSIVKSEIYVGDILQNIFVKLWQTKHSIRYESARAYLYASVRNECLNYLKHRTVQADYRKYRMHSDNIMDKNDTMEERELQMKIQELLDTLPEKCATVFYMCRHLQMSYKEISSEMNISVKTVEQHMSKALRILRSGLAAYLVSLLLVFIFQYYILIIWNIN